MIFGGTGGASALREAWRQFLHGSVAPVARQVQYELRSKLDSPDLSLNFDSLFASDLSGRARAFQSMVGGGMDIAKAASLGWFDGDGGANRIDRILLRLKPKPGTASLTKLRALALDALVEMARDLGVTIGPGELMSRRRSGCITRWRPAAWL